MRMVGNALILSALITLLLAPTLAGAQAYQDETTAADSTAGTGSFSSSDLMLRPELESSNQVNYTKGPLPSEADYWRHKVNQFDLEDTATLPSDINELFTELNQAFDRNIEKLNNEDWSSPAYTEHDKIQQRPYRPASGREEIFQTLTTLYYQRIKLLKKLSANTGKELTGTGVQGVEEYQRELKFLKVTINYRLNDLPQSLNKTFSDWAVAPLPIVWRFLQLIALIVAVYYWSRWAPGGLIKLRSRLMKSRPRTKGKLRLIKLIWYFDAIRAPIVWMVSFGIVFNLFKNPDLIFFIEMAWITIRWILLSWMVVLLINAMIERSSSSLKSENAKLILRSLQYLGAWLVLTGLSLELITIYTGQGALYSWTFMACNALLIVLLASLLLIWKPNIRQGCANETHQNFITEAVLADKPGMAGYLYSLLGALYLLRIYASKKLLNWAANFNTGQQMVDSLVGLDIARAYQQQKLDPDAEPIPAQLQTTLKQQESGLLRQVGNSIVKDILNSAEEKFGGLIILSGEPGCGKSTILQRVVRETERNSLLVSCPKEGIDGLLGEMARKLHIEAEQPSRRIIFQELRRKEIDLLLIDDVHRLVRPYVGGQVQLDQLSELIAENPDLLVVLSLNTATWQFILCARDQRIFDRDALIIQPWSSDQIGSLVKESYTTAEIEPNFSRVIVPRQYDNSNFDDPQDRYFSAFVRMLHSASMGNPKVAMGLWINSLYLDKSGEIFVQLPEIPPSDELDQSSLNALLLLRVICQAETISFEDIVNSLQMPAAVTLAALRNAQHKDWVVAIEDDYYQLNWYWRRVITRVLARKNLMPRFQ